MPGAHAPDDRTFGVRLAHLAHPVPLAAVLVLAINDHVLKGSGWLPAVITGKLSDLAGLFFFPVALTALLRIAPVTSALATGAVISALKTSPAFNALVDLVWGPNVLDHTDLLCLPVLALSVAWMRGPRAAVPRVWLGRAGGSGRGGA